MRCKLIALVSICWSCIFSALTESKESQAEKSTVYWENVAKQILEEQLAKKFINGVAKNVIFFLGDGMSIPTITAAGIYSGQMQGRNGEETMLSFEKFPFIGLSKTYCVNMQVADSACSATAFMRGVKGNFHTIGVNGNVEIGDCKAAADPENQVDSIATWAQKAGKKTGIVTNTRVTHATPAGAYAFVSDRAHESDAKFIKHKSTRNNPYCRDIAKQLIFDKPGSNFNVIFGGGRTNFIPEDMKDSEGTEGQRIDGLNLIDMWKQNHPEGKYIETKAELKSLIPGSTKNVLGLFASDHMDYNLDNRDDAQPSLKEMTESAIKMLKNKDNGFFLFVEGGRIDLAHHKVKAKKALDETVQLSLAVQAALDMTDREDTLIIVTADHAHTMSISGHADRGTDILGFGTKLAEDELPYFTISYANGPGLSFHNGVREDPKSFVPMDKDSEFPSMVPLSKETHGGDAVAIFAIGPHAHLFTGTIEQNAIPIILAYASCIGKGLTVCSETSRKADHPTEEESSRESHIPVQQETMEQHPHRRHSRSEDPIVYQINAAHHDIKR